jgi:cell division inhibitor SepF
MSNPLKKTMVFLGLAEEELEESSRSVAPAQEPAAKPVSQPANKVASGRAPVTPLRKVTPTRAAAPQGMNEILTVHPAEYRDAQVIAESFRDGVPVIINLSRMNEAEAKRLIDFASGLSMGLHGKIERVTSKVFLLSPEHIALSGDEPAGDTGSFFVASH